MPLPNETADDLYNWMISQTRSILTGGPGTQYGENVPGTDPSETNKGNPGNPSPPATDPVSPYGGPGAVGWSDLPQNNPDFPYAIWGGKDNFDAQKPPDWMVKMVDDALAMPDGAAKTARLMHIMTTTSGMPNYLVKYLESRIKL